MIDKFVKISRVGKFADYSPNGDMTLRKVTLVYGQNGRGKSTLAAILRSLQTGEGVHITERMTLNRTGEPEVHIRLAGAGMAKFTKGRWDCPPGKIEIFDTNFVFENVFVGHEIDHEHKKNLYKVIVGEEGVKLSRAVDELDEQIREANRKLSDAKGKVEAKIKDGLKIAKFIDLLPISDIDDQIAAQEKVIAAQKAAGAIATKSLLGKIALPDDPDLSVLGTRIEDLSKAAEQVVADHIKNNLGPKGERWVGEGFSYLADKSSCPFCGQDVTACDLIAAYKAHFSEKYEELKQEIQAAIDSLGAEYGPDKLLVLQRGIAGNETLLEFWTRFIPLVLPALTFAEIETAWKEVQTQAEALLKIKAGTPLDAVATSTAFAAAVTAFNPIRVRVDAYNAAVDTTNASITTKKAETAAGDVSKEETKLTSLQNVKTRHTADVEALCDAYSARLKEKNALDDEKTKAKDALDLYANKIFGTYQDEMNKLLKAFGADFSITNTSRSFVGGKASSSYEITINSQSVPLAESTPGTACFRNTLSMGDRSALALAFFLVKLHHDPELADKCVVFDDPVCSLDRFRMGCTVEQILKVATTAKQVIVLCHDPYCLKKIHEKLLSADVKMFYIDRKVSDSVLSGWDIENATLTPYFEDYFALADFVDNGLAGRDLRDLARKLRVLLEENLRVRFPSKFTKGWLGEFLDTIRLAPAGDVLERMKPQLAKLINLNDYCKKYHHSNPLHATEMIDETELRTYTVRAFDFIAGAN
jgi:wobble nucleotide-excising tRNase